VKKSQNDLRQVVALLDSVPYKRSDDQKNTSFIQMPYAHGTRFCACDELASLRIVGGRRAYGQDRTFGRLRNPSRIGTDWVAKIMGRADLFRPRDIWYWHRNRAAQHEFRPHRFDSGYSRQFDRDGFTALIFSLCLDTTLTLKRRNLCAA